MVQNCFSAFLLRSSVKQGSKNYNSWANSCPLPAFAQPATHFYSACALRMVIYIFKWFQTTKRNIIFLVWNLWEIQILVSTNDALWEHSHAHSFPDCLWLLCTRMQHWIAVTQTGRPAQPEILNFCPLTQKTWGHVFWCFHRWMLSWIIWSVCQFGCQS